MMHLFILFFLSKTMNKQPEFYSHNLELMIRGHSFVFSTVTEEKKSHSVQQMDWTSNWYFGNLQTSFFFFCALNQFHWMNERYRATFFSSQVSLNTTFIKPFEWKDSCNCDEASIVVDIGSIKSKSVCRCWRFGRCITQTSSEPYPWEQSWSPTSSSEWIDWFLTVSFLKIR